MAWLDDEKCIMIDGGMVVSTETKRESKQRDCVDTKYEQEGERYEEIKKKTKWS